MTLRTPHRLTLLAAVIAAVALGATACASEPEVVASTNAPAPQETTDAGASESAAPVEPEAPVTPTDLSCDTLVSADVIEGFTAQGWSVREDPFVIADQDVPGGITCNWGDLESASGDSFALFGWAPITADDAAGAQAALEEEGWTAEESADGTYVTENPAEAVALDENGYGITYLFGNGWVTVADTKQNLILIEQPTS